jgi:hypothetical protein
VNKSVSLVSPILGLENRQRRVTARRRRLPRPFKYLDVALAESYLSQLTDGIPEVGRSTERSSITERGGYGISTRGTGARGGRDTEEGSENQERFRYSPKAIFNQVYEELDRETTEGRFLVSFDTLDKDT